MTREEREQIARKRLVSVLGKHGAAISRTLEQKISDAGPFNQRIDPHILLPIRNEMVEEERLQRIKQHGVDWYALAETPRRRIAKRIAEQAEIHRRILEPRFTHRVGDALEIAVFRALQQSNLPSLGGFRQLPREPTTKKVAKEEPPSIFGGRELSGNKRFDFLVGAGSAWGGIECKNVREWLYPDRPEIRQMLAKSVELNIPPILIARRIPYVTRRLLAPVGAIIWETKRQYYPPEYDNLAGEARDKMSLGYFDIFVSDYPDSLLLDFVTRIIPEELPGATLRFAQYVDLIEQFAAGTITYPSFAARVRRRENGQNEDTDEPEEEDYYEPDDWF